MVVLTCGLRPWLAYGADILKQVSDNNIPEGGSRRSIQETQESTELKSETANL